MLGTITRIFSGLALVVALAACTEESMGVEAKQTSEADLLGTWRTSVPFGSMTIKAEMEIKSDHSVTLSQKVKGAVAANPEMEFEKARETGTWALENGIFKAAKTSCQYADTATYQLVSAPCADAGKEIALNVNGKSWTVVEGSTTLVFLKD